MSQLTTLEIEEIPVEKIKRSPYQPRLNFDLEDLRGSIIQYGIQDPLKVRKVGDHWELIDGERRWRIAQQEGFKTVPCLVLEYSEEEADALAWRFNTERKDYSVEEKAKHFHKHQLEGMSGRAIARIHGYHHRTVNSYLSIFRLSETSQNYIWAGKFSFQKFEYLYEKGLLNSNSGAPPPHAIKLIQQSIDQDLKQKEFEKVTDDFILDLKEKQFEVAKKVAATIDVTQRRINKAKEEIGEPIVREPKTSREFEEAAKVLLEKAEELKKPDQIYQENVEKAQKLFYRFSLNEAKRLGIDVKKFSNQLAEIEGYLEEKPVDALSDLKTIQRELKTEIKEAKRSQEETEKKQREADIQKRIEDEAEQRARKIEEDEKRKIEEEAKKRTQSEILAKPELIADLYKEREDRFDELKEMQARAGEASRSISKTLGEALLKTEEDIQKARVSENRILMANYMMIGSIMRALENGTIFCSEHQGEQHKLLWSCGEPITETYKKLRKKLEL